MELVEYAIGVVESLKIWGRTTTGRAPLTLFWTGSGIECEIKASELWIEVEGDYEAYEPWISIMINGTYVSRQMVNKGRQWICLFRGMNPQVTKNIRIHKEVQAMSEDNQHSLKIWGFKTEGTFLPVPEKAYKFEFIGDSITSGEGSMGAVCEEDWISMWFSTENNYACMVSDLLNAEYRILSKSGWGVYCGWDNNIHNNLPRCYEQVCGAVAGEKNEALGAHELYDFTSWEPDVVFINLGTNDAGAFNSPGWQDEATGEVYKQHLKADGTYEEQDVKKVQTAIYEFLIKVRKNNPHAQILWLYGMIGDSLLPYITKTVEEYKVACKDSKVDVLVLPDTTEETVGARQHPGKLAHQKAAETIAKELHQRLGIYKV